MAGSFHWRDGPCDCGVAGGRGGEADARGCDGNGDSQGCPSGPGLVVTSSSSDLECRLPASVPCWTALPHSPEVQPSTQVRARLSRESGIPMKEAG